MRINPICETVRAKNRPRNRAETEHWAYVHGTDAEFLAFLRTQPSAYDGRYDYIDGKACCQAAHYRTSKNSGIADKPVFSAIPLTSEQHRMQHRVGQYNFRHRQWWEDMDESNTCKFQ